MRHFLHATLRLTLKETAVHIAPVTQGVAFLGFRIFPGVLRLHRKTWTRFKHQVRKRESQYRCGMIDAETLARTVASLVGHTAHAETLAVRRRFFARSLALG